MKFISIRELRSESGLVQRTVAEETVALTSDGKPFALVVGLRDCEDPAELERLIRQARFQILVSRSRAEAQRNGTDKLTMAEIDAEIRAARAERAR
jgi:antitoxin (DNA-binding transcriptional repressor) of toxin-antitoxin stability system